MFKTLFFFVVVVLAALAVAHPTPLSRKGLLAALGTSEKDVAPTIYNGEDADADIVARTVRLYMCFSSYFQSCASCTGAVIKRNWFLTAAHCVQNSGNPAKSMVVFLSGRAYFAHTVYMHAGYTRSPLTNDIALIKIHGVFETTSTKLITYKLATRDNHNPDPSEAVRIAGYGLTGPSSSISTTLQMSTIPRLDDASCFQYPAAGFICTSSGPGLGLGDGVQCGGDSGGPLFENMAADADGNARYRLVGINSATINVGSDDFGCGSNNNLHIHAKVSNYASSIIECTKGTCTAFQTWYTDVL